MDANKTLREKARWELHKIATSYFEPTQETTPHETTAVWPLPISKNIQVRQTTHAEHCWRSENKLFSYVLLCTPIHGHTSVGRPARTYLHQLYANTGCSFKDLPGAIDDRDK